MSPRSGAEVYPAAITNLEILYATDFSTLSWRALACAREIALQRHAFLRSVHVVDLTGQEIQHHTSFHAALESAHRTLRHVRRDLRLAGIRETAIVITGGSPAMSIRDAAVRYDSRLILMGLHGEPGLTVPTFGQTTRKILRQPPCPVLTVGLRAPENSWDKFERVLFVTDADSVSLASAQAAWPAQFHGIPRAHIVVLARDAARSPTPNVTASIVTESASAGSFSPNPVAMRAVDLTPQPCFHEEAGARILAEATRLNANLVVLSIRGGGSMDSLGIGSVARTILTRAQCPVMTVRTGAPTTPMRLDRRGPTKAELRVATSGE